MVYMLTKLGFLLMVNVTIQMAYIRIRHGLCYFSSLQVRELLSCFIMFHDVYPGGFPRTAPVNKVCGFR